MSKIVLGVPCLAEPRDLLTRALRSFVEPDVGVIAVDNGSAPDTKAALAEMEAHITIIRNERNVYVNPAWNQLAERFYASSAEIFALANADLIAAPGWAETLLMRHTQARAAGMRELWFAEWVADVAQVEHRHAPSSAEGVTKSSGGGFFAMPREAVERAFPIPSELRIWYGDAWIFELLITSGYRPVGLSDLWIWQQLGVSTSSLPLSERTPIIDGERRAWDSYLGAACREIGRGYAAGTMTADQREAVLEVARKAAP